MRFEHLLQVNDPADPRVVPMSREALWRGLLVRVESPQRFPLGPDHCDARVGDAADERRRSIRFGSLRFDDRVVLEEGRRIDFHPELREGAAPVRLTIVIEEPSPGALFLRFVYEVQGAPGPGERELQRYREQAWLEMDRDMLRTLRQWQAEGAL